MLKQHASVGRWCSSKKIGGILAATMGAIGISLSFPANAADWSDTYVGYRVGKQYHDCCTTNDIKKDIYTLNHFSRYKYGSNFFNVDFLTSDLNDPIKGGDAGAREIYAVYRHQLSLGAVSGSEFKFGIVKDIAITAGMDLNTKDSAFAPRVRKFVVGPTFKLDVPSGFVDVSLLFRTEQNHNGIVNKIVNYDDHYGVNVAWGIPLKSINSKVDGFLDYVGAKGKDGFGFETKAETLARVYLMYDVGSLASNPGAFYAGIGYEYWNNKYGGDAQNYGKTSAPVLALRAHF